MFAVIYIPDFFLHSLLRVEAGLEKRPVVLIDAAEKKPLVFQLTAAARAVGIAEGMTPTQALARSTLVLIKPRCPAQEKAATDALLQCAYSFSPNIESTADGVCTLDLAGLPNLDHEELANEMVQRLATLHLPAQIGIGENPWLALLAARAARPCCVVSNSTEFLNALPIDAIAPSPETFAILHKWGIHSVGQFVALGKEPLSTRLGPEALALHERAVANSSRPLKLVRPPQIFEESIAFEHEIETIEPLLFILRRFLEQLLVRLEMMYWAAQELRLQFRFESGESYEKMFRIPAPTSNVETLFRMLHTHLETLRTEHPIVALELSATPGRAINHQFGLFESVLRDPNHFHETLARLTALVGAERVGTPVNEEGYKPDAFRMEPVSLESRSAGFQPAVSQTSSLLPLSLSRGPALHRFRPPTPARVQLAHDCPASIDSSVFQGLVHNACGPWRASGQWWETQHWHREEWDVQASNGRFYRLCRQPDGWFVEGVYD
jgi:protein ImuB